MLAAISFGLAACAEEDKAPGQLVVSFDTDMALPQQIDKVRVQVLSRGQIRLDLDYQLGPGRNDYRVPGTLTVVAGNDPTAPVTVNVAGSKQNKWRTFRELTTTVPKDRVANLRMPIQWLCSGEANEFAQVVSTPTPSGGVEQHVISTCEEGNTCVSGTCVPNIVEEPSLPDYDPRNVFGNSEDPAEGSCFDTIACLVRGKPVTPDADCTVERPNAEHINIGLRVPSNNGICDGTATTCFVPLDGNSPEGWQVTPAGDRIQLPQALCSGEQSRTKRELISGIFVSTDCQTKLPGLPVCGDWSSVPRVPGKIITSDATDGSRLPTASVVLSLLPSGGNTRLCCPLMQDGDKLYTCACDSRGGSNVFELKPKDTTVNRINLPAMNQPGIVSAVRNGVLYWTTDSSIERVSLMEPVTALSPWLAPVALYKKNGMLLADGQNVYSLSPGASGTSDATPGVVMNGATPVQLVFFDASGAAKILEPLGNHGVLQFAQTETSLFVGADRDELVGASTRRATSVVQINKADRKRSTVFPEQTVMTDFPEEHGGYLAVHTDGTALYALFEGTPEADVTHVTVLTVDIADAARGGGPRSLYDLPVTGKRSSLQPVGALDGALLVARFALMPDGAVSSSTLLLLRKSGGPPSVLADFSGHYPLPGLAADADNIYWFNDDAKLYSFPRAALSEAP